MGGSAKSLSVSGGSGLGVKFFSCVVRTLAVLVGVPRDLEQRELHEVQEVLLDVAVGGQVLDVLRNHRRQVGMIDANAAELHLQLDELREVGDRLRLARLAELDRGEDQACRDREGRKRLEGELQDLELGGHGGIIEARRR